MSNPIEYMTCCFCQFTFPTTNNTPQRFCASCGAPLDDLGYNPHHQQPRPGDPFGQDNGAGYYNPPNPGFNSPGIPYSDQYGFYDDGNEFGEKIMTWVILGLAAVGVATLLSGANNSYKKLKDDN